jgi:hypothetical protein
MPAQPFDEELPEDLNAVENALRQLTPSLGQLNRDRLMYSAGQASVTASSLAAHAPKFSGLVWPLSTAVLLLICFTLGGMLIFDKQSAQRVQIVASPIETNVLLIDASETPTISPQYFQMRNLVLSQGLDALPPAQFDGQSPSGNPMTWPAMRGGSLRSNRGG